MRLGRRSRRRRVAINNDERQRRREGCAECEVVLRAAGAEVSLIVAARLGLVDVVKMLVAADPDPAHLDMKVRIP